jgi:hypothetical protein
VTEPTYIPHRPPDYAWRALYGLVINAIFHQEEEVGTAIAEKMGGLTFEAFGAAIDRGVVKIEPIFNGRDVQYHVKVLGDDSAWHGLTRPSAADVGLDVGAIVDGQTARRDIVRLLGDIPDDASGLDDDAG